jgi:lipoprotein-anchoring transpeptidase ErfK/SrfK
MYRVTVAAIAVLLSAGSAFAQSSWDDDGPRYRTRPQYRYAPPAPGYWAPPQQRAYRVAPQQGFSFWNDDDDDDDAPRRPQRPLGPAIADGGPRPSISPISPTTVAFRGSQAPGTIVIDTGGRQLLLVKSGGEALRYPISVGREGFSWTGAEKVSRIAEWPDWHPPAEMRMRDPRLPEKMTGGLRNPLGAKAIYLGNTLYRIHGTNDPKSIGRAASSGCFRMLNGHVLDLAGRINVGTQVVVVPRLPRTVASNSSSD